jgi:hypothetical protein
MERRGKGDPNIEASLSVEIDRPLAMGLFLAYLSAERDAHDARIAAMREGPMRSVKSNKQMRVIDDKLRKIDDARRLDDDALREPSFASLHSNANFRELVRRIGWERVPATT